jgi:hypothetical protein
MRVYDAPGVEDDLAALAALMPALTTLRTHRIGVGGVADVSALLHFTRLHTVRADIEVGSGENLIVDWPSMPLLKSLSLHFIDGKHSSDATDIRLGLAPCVALEDLAIENETDGCGIEFTGWHSLGCFVAAPRLARIAFVQGRIQSGLADLLAGAPQLRDLDGVSIHSAEELAAVCRATQLIRLVIYSTHIDTTTSDLGVLPMLAELHLHIGSPQGCYGVDADARRRHLNMSLLGSISSSPCLIDLTIVQYHIAPWADILACLGHECLRSLVDQVQAMPALRSVTYVYMGAAALRLDRSAFLARAQTILSM